MQAEQIEEESEKQQVLVETPKVTEDLLGLFTPPQFNQSIESKPVKQDYAGFNKAAPSRLLDLLADGEDPFKELTEEK